MPGQARRDEHESGDQLGPCDRHLQRNAAAERAADECRPLEPVLLEKLDQVSRVREAAGLERRAPEAAHVVRRTRWPRVNVSHCGSHTRLSQMPSWTRAIAGPSPATSE